MSEITHHENDVQVFRQDPYLESALTVTFNAQLDSVAINRSEAIGGFTLSSLFNSLSNFGLGDNGIWQDWVFLVSLTLERS